MRNVVDYEIYRTPNGATRVNIAGRSYALTGKDGGWVRLSTGDLPGDTLAPRQLAQVANGAYGPVARAWLQACQAAGLEPRFAWRGITNSLGDHNSVTPAFNPREENFART